MRLARHPTLDLLFFSYSALEHSARYLPTRMLFTALVMEGGHPINIKSSGVIRLCPSPFPFAQHWGDCSLFLATVKVERVWWGTNPLLSTENARHYDRQPYRIGLRKSTRFRHSESNIAKVEPCVKRFPQSRRV